jgi:polyisoprenoid-binding protein YceI
VRIAPAGPPVEIKRVIGAATTSLPHGTWRIAPERSAVGFQVRHLGIATVRGRFASFSARVLIGAGGLEIDGQVDAASVDTGDRVRDARLRSEFFDAARFPVIEFRAAVPAPGGSRAWPLEGELTIRGVSRRVVLTVRTEDCGNGVLRLRAEGAIDRSDFGLDWAALRQGGRLLVGDRVRISADVVITGAGGS